MILGLRCCLCSLLTNRLIYGSGGTVWFWVTFHYIVLHASKSFLKKKTDNWLTQVNKNFSLCVISRASLIHLLSHASQDNVVDIPNRSGLDGSQFEPWWGQEKFSSPNSSRWALGLIQPSVPLVPRLFLGMKQPTHGFEHPPLSSAEVQYRVDLYTHSSSVPAWKVTRTNLDYVLKKTFYRPSTEDAGRDSTVGIATRYGLDDLGIKPW